MGTTVLETAAPGPGAHALLRIERHTYWVMPVYLVAEAAWYSIAPATLLSTRIFSMIWIPLAVWAILTIAWRATDDIRVGLLATFLTVIDLPFISTAGFGRPDFLCATFGLAGIALYLELRQRRLAGALLAANALGAASILTHPNGILYCVGLVLVVLWYDRRKLNLLLVVSSAAVYLAAFGLWGLYIAQDPEAFLSQILENGRRGRVPRSLNPVLLVWAELRGRYALAMGFMSPRLLARIRAIPFMSYWIAAAMALAVPRIRKAKGTGLLLSLLGVFFAVQCVFNSKASHYLVHIVPLYAIVLAIVLVALAEYTRRLRWSAAWVTLLLVAQAISTVGGARLQEYAVQEKEFVTFLSQNAGSAKRIFGSAALLYALHWDPRLLEDVHLGYYSGKTAEVLVIDRNYEVDCLAFETESPAGWKHIQARLAEYRLVFRNSRYKVLFLRGWNPQVAELAQVSAQ